MRQALTGLIVAFMVIVQAGAARSTQAQGSTSFDAFYSSNIRDGKPGLFFVDARTGLSNIVVTNGKRHTLLGKGVLFQEADTNAIKIAYPDGNIVSFSAIEVGGSDWTVNWVISSDSKQIAWAVSHADGPSLLSDLFVAAADGSNKKLVFHASSTKGIDTIPLALTHDGGTLFYARQTKTQTAYHLFSTAIDVYSVDTATGQPAQLPNSANCDCAVAFSDDGRLLMRLEATDNQQGFAARLWDLSIKVDMEIAAPGIAHLQAGNLLISRDGTLAVYTSARGIAPAKGVPPEQYMLVLVDLTRHQQRVLTEALKSNLRPVAFEADNSTILLTNLDKDGTYKYSLKDGTLLPDSAYTFVGTITG